MRPIRQLSQLVIVTFACARPGAAPQLPVPEQTYRWYLTMAADSLWPGFDPSETAVAIFDGEDTWLFGYETLPEGFLEVGGSTSAVYRGRHSVVTVNTSTRLGGEHTASVLLELDINDDPATWAGVAIHEAFHVFQQERHADWRPNEADLFLYPADQLGALALRRMETEALRQALMEDPAVQVCWVRMALDFRERRFALIDSASSRYERESERLEGLADYVEARAARRPPVIHRDFLPEDVRARSYWTGTAMAVLLDRFDHGWKERIERGDSRFLDQILSATVPPAPCLEELDTDSITQAASGAIDSLRRRRLAMRQSFDGQAGWSVTVVADLDPFVPVAFDPLNVDLLDDRTVLHRRFIRLANTSGWIEMFERPSLTVGLEEHPLFAGVVEVRIAGLSSRPRLTREDETLIIDEQGIKARLPGAEVSWGQGIARIRVRRN